MAKSLVVRKGKVRLGKELTAVQVGPAVESHEPAEHVRTTEPVKPAPAHVSVQVPPCEVFVHVQALEKKEATVGVVDCAKEED